MKVTKVFACLFLLINTFVIGQNVTVSGFISDRESGEKLIGATVYELHSKKATTTNSYGFYSLKIDATDSAKLIISYIGYVSGMHLLALKKDEKLNFTLKAGLSLSEVVINGNDEIPIEKRNEMGVITIPIKQITALPALGGESDLMKSLQLMPGVKSGNEGSSELYVRGGSADQNLILLDDVPLYNVNHLGGFVSAFNSDAINQVKLIKGGFPAQYGSRLSSIIDVRMKEGNLKKYHGNIMVGYVASKISIEGPIKKDTSSFIISFRRMLLDLITRPLTKAFLDGAEMGYNFYDFNAKINYKLSSSNQLFLSFYMGDDKFLSHLDEKNTTLKIKNDIKWGNMLGSLRFNHLWSKNLFSNISCNYTKYRYSNEMNSTETVVNNNISEAKNSFYSGIYDLTGKIDFEYYVSSGHTLKFGTNSIYHTFKPGATSLYQNNNNLIPIDTVFGSNSIFAWENSFYAQDEFKIGRFQSNMGFRISDYEVNNHQYFSFEPRILINCLITENMSIKASYATMQQNIHLLTSYNVGIPSDLWVPATENVAPSKSSIYSIGVSHSLKRNLFELSLEGYYKDLSNLITYKEGASFIGNSSTWETKVETGGIGKSYGIEFLVQKKEGKTTGWVGYTLSKTTRQFENLNNGKPFNYTYDKTHNISIVLMHKFSDKIDVSATWEYATGNAITLATEKYYLSSGIWEQPIEVYDGINTFRMRSFHKLDVGINFHKKKKSGERIWNVSIYNLYNRKNPYYYYYTTVTEGYWQNNIYIQTQRPALMQKSLFPIILSVSYSFKF